MVYKRVGTNKRNMGNNTKEKHEGYEHRAAKKRIKQTDVYVSNDNISIRYII